MSGNILRSAAVTARRRSLSYEDQDGAFAVATKRGEELRFGSGDAKPVSAEAYAEGRAAGLAQGLADATSQIDQEVKARIEKLELQVQQDEQRRASEFAKRVAALDAVLSRTLEDLPARFEHLERQAIELAFEALCNIAGQEVGRADLLADVVRQGIRRIRGHALLSIRLNPEDLDSLRLHEACRSIEACHPEVRWTADPGLERASCELVTDRGRLDVSLQTQLSRLRDLWAKAGAADASVSGAEDAQ
jgi:flagellar biosynthesis/type III secretory pathway protein FliH